MEANTTSQITQRIQEKFGDAFLGAHQFRGDETVIVKKESLPEIAQFLKEDPELSFDVLMDLSAVDYLNFDEPGATRPYLSAKGGPRFEMVYHLYSTKKNHRLRMKAPVDTKELFVPTLVGVWPAANWYEREVWDMFGIRFDRHPNLKRILMYQEFVGHPLQKDYPVNKRQPLIGPQN